MENPIIVNEQVTPVVKRGRGRPRKSPEEKEKLKQQRREEAQKEREKAQKEREDRYEIRFNMLIGGIKQTMVLGRYKRLLDMVEPLGLTDVDHPRHAIERIMTGKCAGLIGKFIEVVRL